MTTPARRLVHTTLVAFGAMLATGGAAQAPNQTSAAVPAPCASAAELDAALGRSTTDFAAGRTAEAATLLQNVASRARDGGCAHQEAEALRRLARADAAAHSYVEAVEKLERAVPLFRSTGDQPGETLALLQYGSSLINSGKRAEAIAPLRRARDLSIEANDTGNLMSAYEHLMYALQSGPEKDAARTASLDLARIHPDLTATSCNVLHEWGDDLFAAGKLNVAYDTLIRAASCFESVHDDSRLGRVLVSIGRVYRAHGRLDLALAQYQRALALQQGGTDPVAIVQSLNAIAVTLGFMGRSEASLAKLREALAMAERVDPARSARVLRANIAGANLELGHYREAARGLEEAVATDGFQSVRRGQLARAYAGLGLLTRALKESDAAVATASGPIDLTSALRERAAEYLRLRRFEPASADLQRAMTIIDALRANTVPDDFLKRGFGERYQSIYATQMSLYLVQRKPREALETAERARARAFLDLLSDRVRTSEAQLSPVTTPVAPAMTPGEQANAAAASVDDMVTTARRLRTTIVAYWVDRAETIVWVVGSDGRVASRRIDVTAGRLSSLVAEATGVGAGAIQPAGLLVTSSAARPWRELYRLLILPVRVALPSRPGARLTIVPHGPLVGLPFAALQDSRGRYLIEDYELHYVPAAGVLAYTSRPRTARAPSALLVGDPSDALAADALNILPPMPWARKEVAAIDRLLAGERTVLVGDEASEENVRHRLEGRTLVHFATHGVVRNSESLTSYLALRPSGEAADRDGRLTSNETYALALDADLVVLSGCRTALGPITGDGVIGFTRAFLAAGARTVIATTWDVPDRTSYEIMRGFYQSWTAGRSPARSLRDAQLAVLRALRSGRIRTREGAIPESPRVWAAFIAVGEP